MVVIGNIIKATLDITDKIWPESDPAVAQEQLLRSMLERASHTSFGKAHQFKDILAGKNMVKQFAETLPYHDYNAMYQQWWKRQIEDGEAR